MSLSPLKITNFQLAGGPAAVNPVADGEVSIRLNKDCMGPNGQVSTRISTFALDSNGAPVGPPLLWPNTSLVPNDSVYFFSVKDAAGQRILQWQGMVVGQSSSVGFGQSFGTSFGS